MPVKISIEADSIDMVQAMLLGMTRAIAEETGPAVLSDQGPSDIVQVELPLCRPALTANAEPAPKRSVFPDSLRPGLTTMLAGYDEASEPDQEAPPALPAAATQTHPAEIAPLKKRGRKSKLAVVEDVEPPAEVITEEDEAEAEGAVDTAEPEPETTGVSEAQLREVVRGIMDEEGIPAALALLAKGGYRHVKDIPPADYTRVYGILKAKA